MRTRFRGELIGFKSGGAGLGVAIRADIEMFGRAIPALVYVKNGSPIMLRMMATKGAGIVAKAMIKQMIFSWAGVTLHIIVPEPDEIKPLLDMMYKPVLIDIGDPE